MTTITQMQIKEEDLTMNNGSKVIKKYPNVLFNEINTEKGLERIFKSSCIKKFEIQHRDSNLKIITGVLNSESEFTRQYFEIKLEPHKTSPPQTKIHLTISDEPFEFTPKYQKQMQKQTKNNYKYGTIAALGFIAILIPAGILSSGYFISEDEYIKNTSSTLSDLEKQIATAELYRDLNEHETAYKIYEKTRLENPGNVKLALESNLALDKTHNYNQLSREFNSQIIIDANYIPNPENPEKTTLQVLFYPEGTDKSGILIPRTNPGKITLSDIVTKDIIPAIVYSVDSQYPTIVYSKSLDSKPQITDAETLDSIDVQDKIFITPGKLPHPDAKVILSEYGYTREYQYGKNGPLVVYPYGVSSTEDLPAVVFPERGFYPHILTIESISEKRIFPIDYNSDQLAKMPPNTVYNQNNNSITTKYTDIIFEDSIKDTRLLSQINPNIPIRIFPNGPDSIPIKYPAGLDFNQVVELPEANMDHKELSEKTRK